MTNPWKLATIDLRTDAGVALVKGQWGYSDTRIVPVDFRTADADGQPAMALLSVSTHEIR